MSQHVSPSPRPAHTVALLSAWPGVVHAFTGASPQSPHGFRQFVAEVRADLAGTAEPPVVVLAQRHSPELLHLEGDILPAANADGIVDGGPYDGVTASLAQPVLLAVKTADCVPVLAVDPEAGAFAALHAGWRGTAAGILPRLLAHWRHQGSTLQQVRLALGPAVGPCCYAVGEDCLAAFSPADLAGAVNTTGAQPHLGLHTVLHNQARSAGLRAAQVIAIPHCTACHHDADGTHPYASYRRDRAQGRALQHNNASVIGVPRT